MIDPNILELIETLDAAGLDWLGREILSGIIEKQEQEALAFTASEASEADPDHVAEFDQIEFAIELTDDRLTSALSFLTKARDNLDTIVSGVRPSHDQQKIATLVLKGDDFRSVVTSSGLEAATLDLEDLRVALANWRAELAPRMKI